MQRHIRVHKITLVPHHSRIIEGSIHESKEGCRVFGMELRDPIIWCIRLRQNQLSALHIVPRDTHHSSLVDKGSNSLPMRGIRMELGVS